MRLVKSLGMGLAIAAWAVSLGPPAQVFAQVAQASPAAAAKISIADVSLDDRHRLHGVIYDRAGMAVGDVQVIAYRADKEVAQATATPQGEFVMTLPGGGTYHLRTQNHATTVRVWTAEAAPPHAARQLALVHGDVVRGQSGAIPFTRVNPWVVAGVVAIAVAIPVALHNNRVDEGDGS